MLPKYLLLFESFGELITLKKKKSDIYHRFDILAGRRRVGTIECYPEGNILNVSSIEINNEARSKGYGVKSLKELLNQYCLSYMVPTRIFAECVSKHSLNTFVRAYGHPDYMGDTLEEYDTVEDALEKLRDYAEFDSDGSIIGSGAIEVSFDFKAALAHAKA